MKSVFWIILLSLTFSISGHSQESSGELLNQYSADWYNLDPEKNQIYGVAVNQAYMYFTELEIAPVIVAVIDDVVDISRPDLKGKLWINANEIPDNGIDDDRNGYIDDIYGWNYLGNPNRENIVEENLELVRIYRPLKEKYEKRNPKSITKAEKKEYKKYLLFKSEYEDELSDLKEDFAQYAQLAALYKGATAYMKEQLSSNELTINNLVSYQPSSEDDAQVRDFLLMAEREELPTYISENEAYFNSLINYHYNLDFNPRNIVNEAEAAQNNTAYGNNMVWAGNPNHGTHVAGIIAAIRNNGFGVNGVAKNARIMSLRVVPDGDERDKDIALAIKYAVDNGAKVVNMSFGKSFSPNIKLVNDAIAYASQNDVLLIHAAGNDAENNDKIMSYPDGTLGKRKTIDNWISVGASSPFRDSAFVADFSNYGKKSVDILAPGVDILSLVVNDTVAKYSGTSMAAPVVSGIAAVVRGAYPELTAKAVKEIIIQSANIDKKLKVHIGGEEDIKIKKRFRTPGVPSLFRCLVIAKIKTD